MVADPRDLIAENREAAGRLRQWASDLGEADEGAWDFIIAAAELDAEARLLWLATVPPEAP